MRGSGWDWLHGMTNPLANSELPSQFECLQSGQIYVRGHGRTEITPTCSVLLRKGTTTNTNIGCCRTTCTMKTFFLSFLFLGDAPTLTRAGDITMNGAWALDHTRSDSLVPMLEACGAPRFISKVLARHMDKDVLHLSLIHI